MRRTVYLLLLALALAAPLAGQAPRPRRAVEGFDQVQAWVNTQHWPRTVVVDSSGPNAPPWQYQTVTRALAYVATQTRGATARWTVLVYSGRAGTYPTGAPATATAWSYQEASWAVPSYTTVQGKGGSPAVNGGEVPSSVVTVAFTGASGSIVTLGTGAHLVDLGLYYAGAASAATTVVHMNGGGTATLTNCSVIVNGSVPDTSTVDLVKVASGSAGYMYGGYTQRFGTATNTRNIVSEAANGFSLYAGRHMPGTSQVKLMETTGSGVLKLWYVRIDSGATTELAQTAGSIQAYGVFYNVEAPAVNDQVLRAETFWVDGTCKLSAGTGSPEGVVTANVCSLYLRTDGGAGTTLYVKQDGTGNTGWTALGATP